MTRSELCARVASATSLPKTDAAAAAGALFSAIADVLARSKTVTVASIGKFTTWDRPVRAGRNPQTGESVAIAASRVPSFKTGKALREAVNAYQGHRPSRIPGARRSHVIPHPLPRTRSRARLRHGRARMRPL